MCLTMKIPQTIPHQVIPAVTSDRPTNTEVPHHSRPILPSGSRDPSSPSPNNNNCAEPRQVHNSHPDSAATVEVSLASLNLIVLPEVIFVENVETIIISNTVALIHFLITVIIHIRDSRLFLELNLRIGTW